MIGAISSTAYAFGRMCWGPRSPSLHCANSVSIFGLKEVCMSRNLWMRVETCGAVPYDRIHRAVGTKASSKTNRINCS